MITRWQHRWTSTSQLGFEIQHEGKWFGLYRGSPGAMECVGRYATREDARAEADHISCTELRAEAGTGALGHRLVEGRGGIWDVDVALRLAEGHAVQRVTRLREVADGLPDGPILCVPIEIIRDGDYVYREYLLVGAGRAREQHQALGYFEAVYLSVEEAEVSRVPDITDSFEARAVTRQLHQCHPRYVPGAPPCNALKRSFGDLAERVRKHLAGGGQG
jgi:hypothetical protein